MPRYLLIGFLDLLLTTMARSLDTGPYSPVGIKSALQARHKGDPATPELDYVLRTLQSAARVIDQSLPTSEIQRQTACLLAVRRDELAGEAAAAAAEALAAAAAEKKAVVVKVEAENELARVVAAPKKSHPENQRDILVAAQAAVAAADAHVAAAQRQAAAAAARAARKASVVSKQEAAVEAAKVSLV